MTTNEPSLQTMVETLCEHYGYTTWTLAAALTAAGTPTSQPTVHRIRRGKSENVNFALGCAICKIWFVHVVQVRDVSTASH